ncbi:hypothetical protein GCM10010172_50820 [Paractinoplanes ferrugineus]|uniref:Uncharacterized protein n=2 Tax=Paractinoplanes ferrugineus TaxID=113564 RepID=A0A919J983_9ACTN|nr:hypothetical protein Afe05nite_79400 [Actinoplanes ferrugineus]
MICCAVVLSLTACAPATTTVAAKRPAGAGPAEATSEPVARRDGADPVCTKATKVKIGADAFSPAKVTIQRGGFLALVNTTGVAQPLESAPDAGLGTSVVDRQERQVVQFPKAGTFRVTSAGATLRVTVAGESGCGAPKPRLTIGRTTELTVAATENFAVINETGTTQKVTCTPDPGSNRDNTRLADGETQLLAIDEPGRYKCARATVTVTGD